MANRDCGSYDLRCVSSSSYLKSKVIRKSYGRITFGFLSINGGWLIVEILFLNYYYLRDNAF